METAHRTKIHHLNKKSKQKSKIQKNIPRKFIKSLSKNQVGGESCLLETAHHTKVHFMPSTTKSKSKSLTQIKQEVKVTCWKLHTTRKSTSCLAPPNPSPNPNPDQVGGESYLMETAHHTKIHFMPSTTKSKSKSLIQNPKKHSQKIYKILVKESSRR